MISKNKLRQKFLSLRKKRYFDIRSNFFDPLLLFIKKKYKKKKKFFYQFIIPLILKSI